ncbi:organic cation/carnitine transporter 2-like isoform X1 [Stegostoma tigrinum]|uniref:organic cation/carnitine transporter 2-like isoform X1 n=1 Tax=Stegostoma tigrinum TaxID=3053191 RepID=UPI00202B2E7B|nr:organic cation/carnitine transporter 2-like isoform X1 [Stegostoma tigrinum]XP_059500827.1 organic cation/carnitine transporter 2-like isoform X1 [Stegostoma tigrinum]
MQDYDEATAFLGEWGHYQISIFFLLSIGIIPNGYVGLSMVFLADTPQHHCRLSNTSNVTFEETSFTNLSLLLPMVDEQVYSKCTRFKTQPQDGLNDTAPKTEGCVDGWVYSKDRYISTIVSEWDLVCENNWKGPFTMSVTFLGMTSGAFISGHISDRYGRKVVLFGAMIIQTALSFVQVISWSWEVFCILCFFIGFGDISNYVAAFVLGTELLGKAERTAYSTLGVCMFYAVGYIILPGFAYYIRNWRMLLLALTIPEVLYLPFWWLIPESPRWLIAQGRVTEAEKIVQGFAKKNGITHVGVIFQQVDTREYTLLNSTARQKHPHNFLDLVRTSNIRNITILSFLVWMTTSIGYFVLTLGTSNMHGDPYLNCFISAISEIVAYTAAWWMVKHAPRRLATATMLILGGVILLFIQFIPPSLHILSTVLVMIGKAGITISFAIVYVFSAELYPTVVRNMGIGICSMASRIGSIISPYFVYLGTYNRILPFLLMGSFILLAGSFCLLLPETRDQPLPENVQQVQPVTCPCCPVGFHHSVVSSTKTSTPEEVQVQNSSIYFLPGSQLDQVKG